MKRKNLVIGIFLLALLPLTAHAQNKRDVAVRTDKQALSGDETWIYDDLDAAIAEASKSGRPLMVVFR